MNHHDAGCRSAALRLERMFRARDGSLGRDALKPMPNDGDGRSFNDVRTACHDWLMRRDPVYREEQLRWAAAREAQAAVAATAIAAAHEAAVAAEAEDAMEKTGATSPETIPFIPQPTLFPR